MKHLWLSIRVSLLRIFLRVCSLLPLSIHRFNARWMAFLVEKVFKYRVDVVDDNLLHAFPEFNDDKRLAVRKCFYRHLALVATEAIWFGGCTDPKRLHRSHLVEIANPEVLSSMYDKSPSVMVMYTHAGNWEILGGLQNYNYSENVVLPAEQDCCVVYLRQHSEVWDKVLRINRFAPLKDKESYSGYLESRELIRYVLSHRGEKKLYNINTDQRPYFDAPDFVRVDFMHRNCKTMSSAAALAVKLKMGVLYQRMLIKPGGGYTIEYVPITPDGSTMSVEDIMKKYYLLLEDDLHSQPENYLWTHKRWAYN